MLPAIWKRLLGFLVSFAITGVSLCRSIIKRWYRGYNTCSRCDFEFVPHPGSKLAQKREDQLLKATRCGSSEKFHHGGHASNISKETRKVELRKDEEKVSQYNMQFLTCLSVSHMFYNWILHEFYLFFYLGCNLFDVTCKGLFKL